MTIFIWILSVWCKHLFFSDALSRQLCHDFAIWNLFGKKCVIPSSDHVTLLKLIFTCRILRMFSAYFSLGQVLMHSVNMCWWDKGLHETTIDHPVKKKRKEKIYFCQYIQTFNNWIRSFTQWPCFNRTKTVSLVIVPILFADKLCV